MVQHACLECPQGRKKFAKIRGLCLSCYQRLLGEVNAGTTTWSELKAQGRAMLTLKELGKRSRGSVDLRHDMGERHRANGY